MDNFEMKIDLHRQVREYFKAEVKKKATQRKTIIAVSLLIISAAFITAKWYKKGLF